ncbi:MAG: tRNA pseudouridine(65) synthase TruC [Bdellovibrionales bacterium]|nr:tRNA pseudouridine(65) synthase TruC [Bdellovibrionales bacterium]
MELPILYKDDAIVVVNKPSGLLVHRSLLDARETEAAMQLVRDQIGQRVYPVHRLDRPTSGVLVFALNPEAARALAEEFAGQRVRKTYLAVVRGTPPESALIDYALKEELDAIADERARRDKPAQEARTQVERLACVEVPVQVDRYPTSRYALVRATPYSGRKHQIRRHLRHIGHPVIGDVNHGSGKHNRYFGQVFGVRRLLLACTEMCFAHPVTGTPVHVKAPLCEDFLKCVKGLGWGAYV